VQGNLTLSADERRELAREVVEMMAAANAQLGQADRLAFTEPEAAALCGIRSHVLRDARRRGEVAGCLVGKRILYERAELLGWLASRRQ